MIMIISRISIVVESPGYQSQRLQKLQCLIGAVVVVVVVDAVRRRLEVLLLRGGG